MFWRFRAHLRLFTQKLARFFNVNFLLILRQFVVQLSLIFVGSSNVKCIEIFINYTLTIISISKMCSERRRLSGELKWI